VDAGFDRIAAHDFYHCLITETVSRDFRPLVFYAPIYFRNSFRISRNTVCVDPALLEFK
jgi:hypothetical protein